MSEKQEQEWNKSLVEEEVRMWLEKNLLTQRGLSSNYASSVFCERMCGSW